MIYEEQTTLNHNHVYYAQGTSYNKISYCHKSNKFLFVAARARNRLFYYAASGYNQRQCPHRTIIIKYAQSSIMKKLLITRHSPAYWRVTFDNPPLNLIDPHLLLSRRMLPSTWQAVWQLILYHLPRHELESADVLIILVSFVVSNLHPIQEC